MVVYNWDLLIMLNVRDSMVVMIGWGIEVMIVLNFFVFYKYISVNFYGKKWLFIVRYFDYSIMKIL